jgi:hypothetical protein
MPEYNNRGLTWSDRFVKKENQRVEEVIIPQKKMEDEPLRSRSLQTFI